MSKVKVSKDPKILRRLIQKDGLPYPKRFHECDPQSYDIVGMGSKVRSNIDEFLDQMEKSSGGVMNFTSISDFCFEDHEYGWRPRRYAYRGDTPRSTRRPVKNFLRTVLHMNRFKSDEELQAEEQAIHEILFRFPDRMIKIYNMNSLISYLAATPGVTVGPREIMPHLKVHLVDRKYKSYLSSRKYFTKKLTDNGKELIKAVTAWQDKNRVAVDKLEMLSGGMTLRNREAYHQMRMREVKLHYRKAKACLHSLMVAYWDFKLTNDDCFLFLFEYLLAHISNFCKLNPQRQPKKKVRKESR